MWLRRHESPIDTSRPHHLTGAQSQAELLLGRTLDGRVAKRKLALGVDDVTLRREVLGRELAGLLARPVAKQQAVKVVISAREPVERSRVGAKLCPHPSEQLAVLGHISDVHHDSVWTRPICETMRNALVQCAAPQARLTLWVRMVGREWTEAVFERT